MGERLASPGLALGGGPVKGTSVHFGIYTFELAMSTYVYSTGVVNQWITFLSPVDESQSISTVDKDSPT